MEAFSEETYIFHYDANAAWNCMDRLQATDKSGSATGSYI